MTAPPGFVSVVAAAHNAAPYLAAFVEECLDVLARHCRDYELILVDDGSSDDTVARLDALLNKYPCLRLIRLARRFGPDVALAAGLDSAIGDHVVLMEPETDPPAEVPAMLARARAGHGVVTGVATRRQGEPLLQRLLRHTFHGLCDRFLRISYPRYATRFQVLSRAAAAAAIRNRSQCPQWPVLAAEVGYGGATHSYEQVLRSRSTGARLRDKIDRGLSVMVLNSRSPLRLVSYLGIAAGGLNLLYAGYVVLVHLFLDDVARGWTTLSLQISAMFFLVFLILVVVCEYVGRILEETRDRPLYHVLEERNSSVIDLQTRNVLDRSA